MLEGACARVLGVRRFHTEPTELRRRTEFDGRNVDFADDSESTASVPLGGAAAARQCP